MFGLVIPEIASAIVRDEQGFPVAPGRREAAIREKGGNSLAVSRIIEDDFRELPVRLVASRLYAALRPG